MNQEKIGKFILKLRKEKNMSQLDLADKIGVTDRAISKWENGKGLPDISLMQPLCKELNITINDLLSGERVDNKDYQEKFEENVLKAIKYSNKLVIKSILFYLGTFFSGIIIIPILGIIAPTFIICSIIVPLVGLIKVLSYLFKFELAFVIFEIGSVEINPFISLALSIIMGLTMYFLGKEMWKLLMKYLKYIKNERLELEI
ncbi:MAG: helix-turn-helix transcriptional regulator [Bacilli bacterium]|jgi:transcriptional regulator with XRE-family HTH domain|nr:helix-turn-helix transcriptional regulator [Bacilli bacterium]